MVKKVKNTRNNNVGAYRNKSYKRPLWVKVLRIVFLILLSGLIIVAVVGRIKHGFTHFGIK